MIRKRVRRITGSEAIDQDRRAQNKRRFAGEILATLKEIAFVRELPLRQLVADIDEQRERVNLSSTLRLFVFRFYQDETEELATWRKQQSK